MRIAFYAPLKAPTHPVPSGDRRMARLLIELLGSAGHDVRLASELRAYAPEATAAAQEAIRARAEAEVRRLLAHWQATPGERAGLWFTYHLYYRAPDWIGPAVAAALSIPYVVAEASYATKRADGLWEPGHRQTEVALRRAAIVFCLSHVDRPALAKMPGFTARLVDLPPFIDVGERPTVPKRQARAAIGIADDTPLLLAVGMMRARSKRESYRLLAEALRLAAGRRWRLAVAGDGPARGEVEAMLAPLGRDRLAWLGAVAQEEMARVYAAADLLVWPGVDEAYGMVYLEAQAAGLPVVAMDHAGVANVVAEGVSGRLVGAGDVGAFASAVVSLLDDPAARERLGRSARRWVQDERSMAPARSIVERAMRDLGAVA